MLECPRRDLCPIFRRLNPGFKHSYENPFGVTNGPKQGNKPPPDLHGRSPRHIQRLRKYNESPSLQLLSGRPAEPLSQQNEVEYNQMLGYIFARYVLGKSFGLARLCSPLLHSEVPISCSDKRSITQSMTRAFNKDSPSSCAPLLRSMLVY